MLTQQIEQVRNRLGLLQRRSQRRPKELSHDDIAADALEELNVSLEEMQVVDEELRHQNEALSVALRGMEAERCRYRELFDSAPDGYIVTDVNGTIVEANLTASALLGVPATFLAGKPMVVFIADRDRLQFRRCFTKLGQRAGLMDMELALQPRHGAAIDIEARAMAVHDEYGVESGFRWLLRDVTARKVIEQQIRLMNTRLEEMVRERTAQLAEAVRAKDDLLFQEQTARLAGDRARTRLLLLSQASERLAASLDYETTLMSVARLLVQHLADCCLVLLDGQDGRVQQVASAHLNPSKDGALRDLAEQNLFDRNADGNAITWVMKHGEVFREHATEEGGLQHTSALVGNLFGSLLWRSVMIVPLTVRGTVIGALAVATQETEHYYDEDDLELARELSHRASQAIDNARLFKQGQKELEERRRADEALRQANQSLEALIHASPLAIVQIDAGGIVRLWSPAAERLFGWSREEVLGQPLPYLDDESREQLVGYLHTSPSDLVTSDEEMIRRRKDGTVVDIGLWTSLLHDGQGNVAGMVSLIADFGDRKRINDELQQARGIADGASKIKDQFLLF